jgi:hypothetical protein
LGDDEVESAATVPTFWAVAPGAQSEPTSITELTKIAVLALIRPAPSCLAAGGAVPVEAGCRRC